MLIDKNEYSRVAQSLTQYASELVAQENIDKFNAHIADKIENFKPSLMVYGTYNAGKSTLLNAIFGIDEMAKTGDSPETAQVHGYEYKGFIIYDTPGINAPIAHEKVTNEHLSKSEMVLFVLSNDGSLEEEYVYSRISEIVKSNKPILIVLNNKKGIDMNSKEAMDEIEKVNVNLSKIGDIHGIDRIESKIRFCMVNAKSALKGKVENKNTILASSNLQMLEHMIQEVLEIAGNKEVVNALNLYISNFTDSLLFAIDNKINNKELHTIEELLTYLEKYKQQSIVSLKNIANKKTALLADELRQILLSDNVSEANINTAIDSNIQDIVSNLEAEFTKISSNLQVKLGSFEKELANIDPEYSKIITDINNDENQEAIPQLFKDIGGQAMNFAHDKELVKQGVESALKLAKEYLPKLLKGKGKVWIGKTAEGVAAKAGTVLTVLMSGYEMYSAYSEHNKMIEKQRAQVLNAKNSSEKLAVEICDSLFKQIEDIANSLFDDLIINYKKIAGQLSGGNKELLRTKEEVLGLLILIQN